MDVIGFLEAGLHLVPRNGVGALVDVVVTAEDEVDTASLHYGSHDVPDREGASVIRVRVRRVVDHDDLPRQRGFPEVLVEPRGLLRGDLPRAAVHGGEVRVPRVVGVIRLVTGRVVAGKVEHVEGVLRTADAVVVAQDGVEAGPLEEVPVDADELLLVVRGRPQRVHDVARVEEEPRLERLEHRADHELLVRLGARVADRRHRDVGSGAGERAERRRGMLGRPGMGHLVAVERIREEPIELEDVVVARGRLRDHDIGCRIHPVAQHCGELDLALGHDEDRGRGQRLEVGPPVVQRERRLLAEEDRGRLEEAAEYDRGDPHGLQG